MRQCRTEPGSVDSLDCPVACRAEFQGLFVLVFCLLFFHGVLKKEKGKKKIDVFFTYNQ